MFASRPLAFLLIALASAVTARPVRFTVKNVPFHRQVTTYACGDASFEMLMHWNGADIDQRAIIDVLRTSEAQGTLSLDQVRGGHFSQKSSSAADRLFPDQTPRNGWKTDRKVSACGWVFPHTILS